MSEPGGGRSRSFSVDEANGLLPTLVPLLETLQRAHRAMADLHDEVMESIPTNGGGKPHREFVAASAEAARATDAVAALGVMLRDPESGLIDFPAQREERPVFLCWRLGEDTVAWWHPVDTGFAGRQPL